MRLPYLMLLAALLSVAAPSLQATDITLYKLLRPGRVEETGRGDYDRLIEIINASISKPVKLRFNRLKRNHRILLSGEEACTAPTNITQLLINVPEAKAEDFIASNYIDVITGHILSRPSEPVVRSIEMLRGKKLAVWWGVPEDPFLSNTGAILERATTEDQAIQLLFAGRVDYAWGWLPDTPMHYKKKGYETPNFDINFTLLKAPATITCRRSAATEAFIAEVNDILEIMRGTGHLKTVLSPFAQVAGVDVAWEDIKE